MACFDPLHQGQVLSGGDVVVFVGLQTLASIVTVEPEVIQTLEYLRVDWH